jgi:hypothetical protein
MAIYHLTTRVHRIRILSKYGWVIEVRFSSGAVNFLLATASKSTLLPSEAHPTSYKMGNGGYFLVIKRSVRESPPSVPRLMREAMLLHKFSPNSIYSVLLIFIS